MTNKAKGTPKVGGWIKLSERRVYQNPWICVTHEEVLTPKNTPGIYGVVHFIAAAVGILPIDASGNTWLVHQSRYTLNQFTWEIPEGGAAPGEEALAAAKRELREEVGLRASRWHQLMTLHTSNSVTDEKAVIFVAEELEVVPQKLDPSEDITVKKLHLREAREWVREGKITDAMSVAAILSVFDKYPDRF